RVEVKNITGFKEIERALNYEVQRQKQQDVKKETRGWDAEKGITYSMRTKEEEEDYGYIAETDLPLFEISQEWIRKVQETIPELAEQRAIRWIKEWKIDEDDARIIAADLDVAVLFEEIAKEVDPVFTARWTRRELLRLLNDKKKELRETAFNKEGLTELFKMLVDKKITDRIGQRIIEQLAEKKFSPTAYVKEQKLEMVAGEDILKKACEKAIAENQKAVDDYKKGEEKALQFIIGQVMKATKGTAAPNVVKELLKGLLK
ncbi:Asp-tRNA(Asn)/Glu-tRNA(Gln) amidotransferase GatCAB subunit B, partial [Candidatus Woesearchaeota archaeon]|nr:Asp-tRNA(Asn)/Glu-tRNA(Gln) amidotransferase GatCAB subunit B [Candidatus Woesearchaeota archaeon]